MKENDEGFMYPSINENCTNCGMCLRVCPHLTNKLENETPDCFAFLADDEIRIKSSSGGAFPILANYFIEHDGYVAGAIYNEDISVHHIVSNKLEDIEKMRNSKYLQSNIDSCYSDTKKILDNNYFVLFTGTPCQIAGLHSFLQKDYENLYCIDIICHGVPSPKVFRKYINEKIKSSDEKWLNTIFRDKLNGLWSRLTTTTTTTTTTTDSAQNDLYMRAFLSNLCLRQTCTNCQFQTIPRQGDITIGDFWGIWNFDKNLNDEKGTSVVLKNNKKGEYLINILKQNAKVFKPIHLKYALDGNLCLMSSVKPHKDRQLFFMNLDKVSFKRNVEMCLEDKVDYLIVNFWDSYYNYGALLTAYAMQKLVTSFNYSCKLLDTGERSNADWFKNSFMEDFTYKFLNVTNKLSSGQCAELSKNVKGVILGSDQILRLDYIDYNLNKYLLNWVDVNTRKLAISASFGIEKKEFLKCEKYKHKVAAFMKSALQSFDYLSCRETSGKEIFKDVFNLASDQILDPVFLIDREEYNDVIKTSSVDNSNKIVSYVLDDNTEYEKIYRYMSAKLLAPVVKLNRKDCFVQDWLKSIKEAKYVLTDSFHGVCFALIFNKPFLCVRNKHRGDARFSSLIELFDISDNFVNSISDIYEKDLEKSINYEKVNQQIKSKKETDLIIVRNVLCNNYSNNPPSQKNKIKNKSYIQKVYAYQKTKLKMDYYRCRFLANITFGKKRNHYIDKKHQLKFQFQEGGLLV